jgi:hypothetical protein
MAATSIGLGDLLRGNIDTWADDLQDAVPSTGVNSARAFVSKLGIRISNLHYASVATDHPDEEDPRSPFDTRMPPPPLPAKLLHGLRRSLQNDEQVVNKPSVCFHLPNVAV